MKFSAKFIEKFNSLFAKGAPDSCWLWTGGFFRSGYGSVDVDGKTMRAHRVAFVIAGGTLIRGLEVTHSCDTPACVNPRHLIQDTHDKNMKDAKARGRINAPRGVEHGLAKATPAIVRAIRFLDLWFSRSLIAERFRLGKTTVQHIANGDTWKHVV